MKTATKNLASLLTIILAAMATRFMIDLDFISGIAFILFTLIGGYIRMSLQEQFYETVNHFHKRQKLEVGDRVIVSFGVIEKEAVYLRDENKTDVIVVYDDTKIESIVSRKIVTKSNQIL